MNDKVKVSMRKKCMFKSDCCKTLKIRERYCPMYKETKQLCNMLPKSEKNGLDSIPGEIVKKLT